MSQSTVVSVRQLGRSFGRTSALSNVNFAVKQGSIVGVLGPNGSGKTTLMKHLVGLLLPQQGHVDVFGTPVGDLSSSQMSNIGYVSQSVELLNWLTVGETLAFARAHHPDWDGELAAKLGDDFGLRYDQKVGGLSGGLKQRLAIILGVAHRPDLILLDEPAAALDPVARQDFLDVLMDLIQEPQRTILISSHILTDVEKVIDQVLILDGGSVHCCQSLDDLRDEYYRVQLTTVGGDLPAELGISGVKHLVRDGATVTVTVHSRSRSTLDQEVGRLACGVKIRHLVFEEIYRLVVTGK